MKMCNECLEKIRKDKDFSIVRKKGNTEPFDNQIDCAIESLLSFEEDRPKRNYLIIKGCTQAGKTGVFIAMINLIYKFNLMESLHINTIYYITGDNSRQIKKQTTGNVIEGCIDTIENMEAKGLKVVLLKQSDMNKWIKKNPPQELNNAFIFIDESHYGSKKEENILISWLRNQGLSLRNDSDLVDKNVYIASNSATPYGEVESDLNYTKRQILLRTGDGYRGLWDFKHYYRLDKQVFSDEKTVEFTIRQWYLFLKDYEKKKNKTKCVIARITLKMYNKYRDIINEYFDVKEINSSCGNIDYESMEDKIMSYCSCGFNRSKNKYLMIVVQGGLRMGVRINEEAKNYIGVVYDFIADDENVSATEQGILGRICGYRKGKEFSSTCIYARRSHIDALLGFYNEEYVTIEDEESNEHKKFPSIGTIARTPYSYYTNLGYEFSMLDHSAEYGKSDWTPVAKRFDYENCESDYNDEWSISPQEYYESKIGTSFFKGIDNFQLEDLRTPHMKYFETFVEPFLKEQDIFYCKSQVLGTRRYVSEKQGDVSFCKNFKTTPPLLNSSAYKIYLEGKKGLNNIGKTAYRVLLDVRDLNNISIATVTGRIMWGRKIMVNNPKKIKVIKTMDTSKAK